MTSRVAGPSRARFSSETMKGRTLSHEVLMVVFLRGVLGAVFLGYVLAADFLSHVLRDAFSREVF